jgi:hypothetical protein
MRSSPKEQRLQSLEGDFAPLLIACLRECAAGRWGLFGQNDSPESRPFQQWDEADQLRQIAKEIQNIRRESGSSNPFCEKFLEYCSMRGANVKGEPKLARQFLDLIRAT